MLNQRAYDAERNRPASQIPQKRGVGVTDTVYFGGRPIARRTNGHCTNLIRTDLIYAATSSGQYALLAEVPGTQNGAPVYRVTDHLGSTVGNLLADGTFVNPTDYTPFGQVFNGGTNDPYLFTGYERDAESGLDYASARHYSSGTGRFMSPDPSGLIYADPSNPQSLNLYSYVRNNPMVNVDPNGEFCYSKSSDGSEVSYNNDAGSADDCAKGETWVDGKVNSSWYGSDGVLQLGYTGSDGSAGVLGFASPDVSLDSSGDLSNPWLLDLNDNTKYNQTSTGSVPGVPTFNGVQGNNRGQFGLYNSRLVPGTHWCGPGGGGPTTNADDVACRAHDRCYAAAGVSAAMNLGTATPSGGQAQAMAGCNQALYNAVSQHPELPQTPFLQYWLTTGAFGHLYPGTEAKPPMAFPRIGLTP